MQLYALGCPSSEDRCQEVKVGNQKIGWHFAMLVAALVTLQLLCFLFQVASWQVVRANSVCTVCCASFPTLVGRHWYVRLSCAMHRVYAFQCDFYMGSIANSQAQLMVVNFRVTGSHQGNRKLQLLATWRRLMHATKTRPTPDFSVYSWQDLVWQTADDCILRVLLLLSCC